MTKKQRYELTPDEIKKAAELEDSGRVLIAMRDAYFLTQADHIRLHRVFWQGVGARLGMDVYARNYRLKAGRIVLDD